MDFELELTRVVNNPLSPNQSQLIDMDNASDKSIKLLEGIGYHTGIKQKDSPKINQFFTTKKTIYVNNGVIAKS